MLTNRYHQSSVSNFNQANNGPLSESSQPVAAPTVQGSTNVAPASNSTARSETPVNETLTSQINLPDLQIAMPENALQTALIAISLILAIIVILQRRRWHRLNRANFEILAAEDDKTAKWHNTNVPMTKRDTFAHDKFVNASSWRITANQEDDDTSKRLSANNLNIDEAITHLYPRKVDQQIVGHLVRVTSEPRLPAELTLYGSGSVLSTESQISIGRHSKRNTVVINDKSVSRDHAVIVQRDEHFFVRDKASTAGTLLNWKRLQADREQPLQHNDILSFGEAVYEFHAFDEDSAPFFTNLPKKIQN